MGTSERFVDSSTYCRGDSEYNPVVCSSHCYLNPLRAFEVACLWVTIRDEGAQRYCLYNASVCLPSEKCLGCNRIAANDRPVLDMITIVGCRDTRYPYVIMQISRVGANLHRMAMLQISFLFLSSNLKARAR